MRIVKSRWHLLVDDDIRRRDVQALVELRKHKELPEHIARDLMRDRTYFGTMMAYQGRVDGMVSGATTTTRP